MKKRNLISKVFTYIKALFCRNLALEYHKVTPQTERGIYVRPYTNFKQLIWTMRVFGFILIFSAILILNIADPSLSTAASSVNISGNAYQGFGITPVNGSITSKTVQLRVNGAGAYTDEITTADGAWSISGISVNSGDVVTVYLDDETEEATTVFITNETSQSNVNLYQNHVILRADTGSISNANLVSGDNGDDDIKYSVVGSDVSFDSGFNVYVWTGDTYNPGGSVTTQGGGDFRIGDGAIVNMDDYSITVSGSWKNEGTYNPGNNLTTLNATAGIEVIDNSEADSVMGADFNNLVINDGGSGATYVPGGNINIAKNLTIDGGTLDMSGPQVWYLTDDSDGSAINSRRMKSEDPAGVASDVATCTDGENNYNKQYCVFYPTSTSGFIGASQPSTFQSRAYMLNNGMPITGTFAAGSWSVNVTRIFHQGYYQYDSIGIYARLWKVNSDLSSPTAISNWTVVATGNAEGAVDSTITLTDIAQQVFADQILAVEFMVRTGNALHLAGSGATTIALRVNEGGTKQKLNTPAYTPQINVGGDFDNNDTFTHQNGKIVFNAVDSDNTISSGGSNFYDIVFQGDGGNGTWAIQNDDISVVNTLDVDTGDTVNIGSDRVLSLVKTTGTVLTLDGTIGGAGRLDYKTSTAFPTTGTISSILRIDGSDTDQTIPARNYGGDLEAYHNSGTSHNFILAGGPIGIAGSLRIIADSTGSPMLATANAGDLTIGGDFDYTGSGAGSEGLFISENQTWTVSGNYDLTGGTLLTFAQYNLIMNGTNKTLTSNGISLENFEVSGGSISLIGSLSLNGSIVLSDGTLSSGGNDITVLGDWLNTGGEFVHGNAKVIFNSDDAGEVIEAGASTFYDVEFDHASGGWTIQTDDLIVANDLTLTNASSFVLDSGRTLEVQGNFINSVGGANTTWSGSTLYLNDTSELDMINTKISGADMYGTLRIGGNDGIGMWNSNADTITVDSGGCLESFDHNASDGYLNIYGSCNSRSNEYWAYETDFDSTDLSGGGERQAIVRFSPGASYTVDQGNSLLIQGESAGNNQTQISRLSTGNFGMNVAGTINARYYDFDYLNASGLNISSTATVVELSDGSFDNIASGANSSYISLVGLNSNKSFNNIIFDSASDGVDSNVVYNVNANGPAINWTFAQASGLRSGENYDREINGAQIAWTIYFSAINDGLASDSSVTNNSNQLSGNWTTATDDNIDHFAYAIGTTSGGNQIVDYTDIGMSKNFTRNGLTLINGATYYITVRAYNVGGEVLESVTSNGITVDTSLPTFSNIVITPGENSFSVTWTSNEPANSIIHWGLTETYGNITVGGSERSTVHNVTVTGLADGTTYHFMIAGTDAAGNTGESTDKIVTTSVSENTIITNVQVTNVKTTSVLITWTTNHAADSKVRYGISTDYGDEVYLADLVTSHEVLISNLLPNTKYHYEVLSTGNTVAIDADATFLTLGDDEDLTPPAIPTIIAPTMETIVNTTRPLITGLAESNNDVFILVDRELVAVVKATNDSSGTGNFHYQLKDPLLFGKHSIVVRARDTDGMVSPESKSRIFSVNPPYPVPTVQTPLFSNSDGYKVSIPGLAINGSQIRVYLNGLIVSTYNVQDDISGTANFNVSVDGLGSGLNVIEIDAVGRDGKVSIKTEPLKITINQSENNLTEYRLDGETVRSELFYEVKSGDSLWKLAQQFYGNGNLWNHISYANQDLYPSLKNNPGIIKPRWNLKIPTLVLN